MDDLSETEHESFRLPTNKDIKIWRYMNIARYLWMLHNRALFFARATLLGDPFEGSSTKLMVTSREHIRTNRATDPALASWKDMPEHFFANIGVAFKNMVNKYLVSCWHMNEHESAAMWKLYSSYDEAVCIQSTYRRLRLAAPVCVLIGEISYINYDTEAFSIDNAFNFIMHKRVSFSHERELRAIFWEMDGSPVAQSYKAKIGPNGMALAMDLTALIERVYVSPTAPQWFAEVVEAITKKYSFTFPVTQSTLAAAPLF
jgi:hypothetical protein